jgi:hypothetical protein
MRTITVLIAIIPVLAAQPAPTPAKAPAAGSVYIVTRAATAESRALLSARLIKMNAANLHWYRDANVVRAAIPKKGLAAVRADRDVVLVLSEHDHPAQVSLVEGPEQEPEAPAQKSAVPVLEPAPPLSYTVTPLPPQPQAGCGASFAPPPMGQFPQIPGPMGAPPGMGMGMGMGLMDSLAGGVASKLLNRPPSCKISIGKHPAKFTAAGGDAVIDVDASGSCAWQAQASVDWIKITSGSGVSGSGVVSYTVMPSAGKARSGSVWIIAAAGGSPTKGKASQVVTQAK